MRWPAHAVVFIFLIAAPAILEAQDTEPRRWTHLPTGVNVIGVGLNTTSGDILFDPVLQIEDAKVELHTLALVYMRSFDLFGKSARIDATLPYSTGRWDGLLRGEPASVRRRGFFDPVIRLSVLLYGAPAMSKAEFAKTERSNTVVGAGIYLRPPLGEYYSERLINLGTNRWTARPQLGVTHTRGKWTYELTGSFFWYSDNDNFWQGKHLENDILYALQGHLIYTFRPGLWASLSTAYGDGATATIDDVTNPNSTVENWLFAASVGVPINRQQGLKFSWMKTETQNDTGANLDSFTLAWSFMF
jgi:hypothetical protein